MSEAEWSAKETLEQAIIEQLKAAAAAGNAMGPEAAKLAQMHARWIRAQWGEGAYSPDAHVALAQSYLEDERFVNYYDSRAGEGATAFLGCGHRGRNGGKGNRLRLLPLFWHAAAAAGPKCANRAETR